MLPFIVRLHRRFPHLTPATLLISGIAFSTSTACISMGIANAVADNRRVPEDVGPSIAPAPTRPSVVAAADDPDFVRAALLPALPPPVDGGRTGAAQLKVTRTYPPSGLPAFEIEAYGDFATASATAFGAAVKQLLPRLKPGTSLNVSAYRDTPSDPRLMLKFAIP